MSKRTKAPRKPVKMNRGDHPTKHRPLNGPVAAPPNRKNVYRCRACGGDTITVDLHEGVTPMFLRCRKPGCDGQAVSAMYPRDVEGEPTHEWYCPASTRGLSAAEREHVALGGLLLREIIKGE